MGRLDGKVALITGAARGQGETEARLLLDRTPMGRKGTPLEIAYGALFLASDEASFMTGAELVIDGGMTAV